MRRASLAALTLAAAAGIHRRRPRQDAAQDPAEAARRSTAPRDLAELRGRLQLRPRRPLPRHQLLRRHPLRARLPAPDPDPELRARPRHRPARALGGRGGLRVHPRLAEPSATLDYAQEGLDTAFDADFCGYRQRRIDSPVDLDDFVDRRAAPVPGQPRPGCQDDTPRAALRRGHRPRARHQLAEHLRARASTRTAIDYTDEDGTSLTPRRYGRGRARSGRCGSPRCSRPAVSAATIYYNADDAARQRRSTSPRSMPASSTSRARTCSVRAGLGYADRNREETIDGERADHPGRRPARPLRGDISYDAATTSSCRGNARLTTAAPRRPG